MTNFLFPIIMVIVVNNQGKYQREICELQNLGIVIQIQIVSRTFMRSKIWIAVIMICIFQAVLLIGHLSWRTCDYMLKLSSHHMLFCSICIFQAVLLIGHSWFIMKNMRLCAETKFASCVKWILFYLGSPTSYVKSWRLLSCFFWCGILICEKKNRTMLINFRLQRMCWKKKQSSGKVKMLDWLSWWFN